VVALAAICDLVLAQRLGVGRGAVGQVLGGPPEDVPDRYATADPMQVLPLGVPAVLVHGDQDDIVPIEVSRSFHAAAAQAGDRVELWELPHLGHVDPMVPRSRAWGHVVRALAHLLA
jgi:pimeloyl-ACP methyl ester carboxylesterase